MISNDLTVVSVRELFDTARYQIPIYQRAYAWGRTEIETLLRDILDYSRRKDAAAYYIGSLVVHADHKDLDRQVFEVVDGQQRLTTLFLILCHPLVASKAPAMPQREQADPLTFEGRARSTDDLALLAKQAQMIRTNTSHGFQPEDLQDAGIRAGYKVIDRVLRAVPAEFTTEDIDYLLNNVHLVRSPLPSGTDLNHYFEIMNDRGEQLEKHEIVKAQLLSCLDEADRGPFAHIWDACSDMSKHVQAKFPPAARTQVFGTDWDTFQVDSFATLAAILTPGNDDANAEQQPPTTIAAILATADQFSPPERATHPEDDDNTGRYGSIIDFPNFLLHALKAHRRIAFSWERTGDGVPLDDKQLIELFAEMSDPDDVKSFVATLLRLRFLFDNFVIKTDRQRDNTEDDSNWVLLRARRVPPKGNQTPKLSTASTFGSTPSSGADADALDTGLQKQVLMLQSMFQVTDSGRSYKNFLYGILRFLQDSPPDGVNAAAFVGHLHKLADDRYDMLRPTCWGGDLQAADGDGGVHIPHFIFNYLDYKLWLRSTERGRTHLLPADGVNFARLRSVTIDRY